MINKIGLIFGFIGLILSIIGGVTYYRTKKYKEELIAKTEAHLADVERDAKLKQDSTVRELKSRDSMIIDLIKAQKDARLALNEAVKEGKSLAASLRQAKADKDTVLYYAKCDSLAEHTAIVELENVEYQKKVDTLNSSYTIQLHSKDSLLAQKDALYSQLRQSYAGSTLKNEQLSETNRRLELKLQSSRKTTKIVALIGGAVAGAVYLSTR